MGRRGPPPKPSSLRILQGNPGKRGIPQNEPRPSPIAPKPPTWLDKEAKREWKRVAPELERMKLLTTVDAAALSAYCQAYSMWLANTKTIQTFGYTFSTETGYIVQRPEVTIVQRSMQIIRAFCQEFGFTPSARACMGTGKGEPPAKELLAFINRGQKA